MKNLLKSFLLAASACVLLAGCNGLGAGDATVDSGDLSEGFGWLTISVDDFMGYRLAKRSAARTINPISLSDEKNQLTKFVLKGKSTITGSDLLNEDDEVGIELTFTDADNDETTPDVASAQIPFGAWDLTLEAYSGSVVVLQGRTYVDLKTPKTSVGFSLSTDNLTTPGSVELGGSFVDADGVAKKYTVGLFSLADGTLKYPVLAPGAELTKNNVPATGKTFTYSETDVKPGRYSFQLRFYNESNDQVGFWEDVVVVAPGRATSNTSIACGNIIMQLPESPLALMAYYVDNSEDEDGNYKVHLTWRDGSNNEENFVIYIDEYNGIETTAAKTPYAILGVKESASDKKEIFWESTKNAGGSIRTSSEECWIKLPLGKIFDISITAENFVGESQISDTVKGYGRVAATETIANETAITSSRINRMAIAYDLDNGTLTLADDGSKKNGTYTLYKSIYEYADDAAKLLSAALLEIDNSDDDANHLVSGRYPFDKWVKADGTAIAATDSITYEGIEVKATYNKSTNITYTVDNMYYTISATAKYGTGTTNVANTSFNAETNNDITFAVTAKKRVKRLIANSDPAEYEYVEEEVADKEVDWISVSITNLPGDPIDSGKVSGASYTFDGTNGLMSGPHTVTVKAHFAGEPAGTVYEFTFALGLER